jgi:copper homeostasis protein (lipoprotein)
MRHVLIAVCAIAVVFAGYLDQSAARGDAPAVPFSLPATFQGVTPCADCPGIRTTVTLNADGSYKLEREYLERSLVDSESGRWEYDRANERLTLRAAGTSTAQYFSIVLAPSLFMLDVQGRPLGSGSGFSLARVPTPSGLALGSWTLTELGGKAFHAPSAQQVVTMSFDAQESQVSGSGGCNRYTGKYDSSGSTLHLGPIASTRMMCASGSDTEQAFFQTLDKVASYSIDGDVLSLRAADGTVLAKLGQQK